MCVCVPVDNSLLGTSAVSHSHRLNHEHTMTGRRRTTAHCKYMYILRSVCMYVCTCYNIIVQQYIICTRNPTPPPTHTPPTRLLVEHSGANLPVVLAITSQHFGLLHRLHLHLSQSCSDQQPTGNNPAHSSNILTIHIRTYIHLSIIILYIVVVYKSTRHSVGVHVAVKDEIIRMSSQLLYTSTVSTMQYSTAYYNTA